VILSEAKDRVRGRSMIVTGQPSLSPLVHRASRYFFGALSGKRRENVCARQVQ